MWELVLTLLLFIGSTFLLISILISLLRTGVPTIASARAAQKKVGEYLNKKNVRLVYELGSGKGDFVFTLARLIPEARIIGFELSPVPFLISKIRWLFSSSRDRIVFKMTDFNKNNLSRADAVAFYLMPGPNKKVAPKLTRELKDGSTVASVSFSMPGWRTTKTIRADNFSKTQVFIYEMPTDATKE